MSYQLTTGNLAANVAAGGTVAIGLPTNVDVGRVQGALGHVLEMNNATLQSPKDFSVTLAGSTATVTNKTAGTWLAGSPFTLQLNQPGDAAFIGYGVNSTVQNPLQQMRQPLVAVAAIDTRFALINLGSPVAKSATAILNAGVSFQTSVNNPITTPVVVPGGAAGRALQMVSSNVGDTTQTVTIVGTDYLGVTMTQALVLNGTTIVNGTKAFSTVTSIKTSALILGTLSVGTLDVLGLPVPLNMLGMVIQDLTNGAKSGTQGTFIAADNTSGGSTGATGDVRGTFLPNVATNGTNYYHILMAAPDFYYPGESQF